MSILSFIALFLVSSLAKPDTAFRFETNQKTILMGNEAVVASEESLPEVVFIGRKLEVFGQIQSLTVVTGETVVHAGGKVSKLVLVQGKFQTLGGQVPPPQEIEYRDLGFWWNFFLSSLGFVDQFWRQIFYWAFSIISVFLLWGFTLLAVLIAPRFAKRFYQEFFYEIGGNFFSAFLFFMMSPPLWVLFVISIVGIFLLPFLFAFYLLLAFFSYLYLAYWLGHRVYPSRGFGELKPLALLLGFGILQLIWISGHRYSWVLLFIFWFLSFGQLVRMIVAGRLTPDKAKRHRQM